MLAGARGVLLAPVVGRLLELALGLGALLGLTLSGLGFAVVEGERVGAAGEKLGAAADHQARRKSEEPPDSAELVPYRAGGS